MTNKPEDSKVKEVAGLIQEILETNEMALQPFMQRTIEGDFAAVRLVSTKEEELQKEDYQSNHNDTSDVNQGTDTPEAGESKQEDGAAESKQA